MKRLVYKDLQVGDALKLTVPLTIEHWFTRFDTKVEVLIEVLFINDDAVTFSVVGPGGGDPA